MDLRMPGMNGVLAIRAIRAAERFDEVGTSDNEGGRHSARLHASRPASDRPAAPIVPPGGRGVRMGDAPARLPEAETVVRREPVGVVAAVIPWNAPQQAAVKLIPALLGGCSSIPKLAPETALDGQVDAQQPPTLIT